MNARDSKSGSFRSWLLAFGLVACSALYADDWPMLGRDATRNAVSLEKNAPVDWDTGTYDPQTGQQTGLRNVRWTARLGSETYGDPVVSGGLVWVGTNNGTPVRGGVQPVDASVLMCFRESDGTLLYKYVSPRLPQGRVHDWPSASMSCSPFLEGDRMWFVTNRCETVCLDIGPLRRQEGEPKIVWKVDMLKEFGVFPRGSVMNITHICSIAGYQDMIYVITGNGADIAGVKVPAPAAPSLICFNKNTGDVVWRDNSPGENILFGQFASPLVLEIGGRAQVIAPQGDGWIRSFDALTGQLIWKFDINRKDWQWHLSGRATRNMILATPVFHDNRIYIANGKSPTDGEGPGRLCCIDPTKEGDISSELAVDAAGNVISHRRLRAVDETNGERAIPNPNSGLIWEFTSTGKNFEDTMHTTVSSVAAHKGLVIAPDYSGLIHCLDAVTGKRYWSHDRMAATLSSPLIVDDKVYIADEDGDITIFGLSADPDIAMRRTGGPHEPIAEIHMETAAYASPIFANGTLYIANRTALFAIPAVSQVPEAKKTSGHWPQWRGPSRDNISRETELLEQWPDGGPPLVWRTENIGEGIASVSVADGRVYTMGYLEGTEYAMALDHENGERIWATAIGPAIQESPLMRWLSQRSPTVDKDRVYIMRADGDLVCLNSSRGSEIWRKSYPKDFQTQTPIWGFCDHPLVDGEQLVCVPGGVDGTVVALDKVTGDLLWRTKIPGIERNGYSPPILAEIHGVRQYVVALEAGLFGIDARDGGILWHHAIPIHFGASQAPIVSGDRVVLAGRREQGLMLLKLVMNNSRFEVRELYRKPFNFSTFHDTSLLTDNGLYACRAGDILMRLNVATGDVLWEARVPAGQRSAARRSEGRGSGVSVTYADGRIYARHTLGRVTLIEPSADGLHERGSFDIPDHVASMGVTNPVIAGGRLFLRDDNRLFCYDVRVGVLPAPPPPAKVTVLRIPQALTRSPTNDGETERRSGPRSVFVPTPHDIVDKMLELARVKPTDLVYDLGSGDGRVPMAAATKYGCRAFGVEIDTELVNLSRAHIKKQGLDHLVTIEEKDVFTVDLGQADVVVLYLLPNQLEKLIPQLKKLKPGSRVVSHQFQIPNLADQRTVSLQSNEDDAAHTVYLWTAPGGE